MKRPRTLLFAILSLLLLCFIWGQSLLPRDLSAEESSRLMLILKPILDPNARIDDAVFHHYLRKTAHFSEYAALGFCISGFLWSLHLKKRFSRAPVMLLASLLIAAADEAIQLFSEGRGAQLRDVVLDFCGALFGLAIYLLLSLVIHSRKKNSRGSD